MSIGIKICGLTDKKAVDTCVKSKVNFIGCSFYKDSPRNVDPEYAAQITSQVPSQIQKVANCCNPSDALLNEIFNHFKPDYIQLDDLSHPDRSLEIKKKYRCKIIKTIYISVEEDVDACKKYLKSSDMFLFDARHRNEMFVELPDTVFDWNLLKSYNLDVPWILSGGLNRFNVQHAIRGSRAKFVNGSSTLENTPGIKDPKMIEEFIKAVRVKNYF